jgi:hypothetical protein
MKLAVMVEGESYLPRVLDCGWFSLMSFLIASSKEREDLWGFFGIFFFRGFGPNFALFGCKFFFSFIVFRSLIE